jgi:hypothetical protein
MTALISSIDWCHCHQATATPQPARTAGTPPSQHARRARCQTSRRRGRSICLLYIFKKVEYLYRKNWGFLWEFMCKIGFFMGFYGFLDGNL